MQDNLLMRIIQSLDFSKQTLNSITVCGIDNCNKLSAVYNNIDVLLNMISSGDITIIDNKSENNLSDEQNE